jgi:hypothetical protein
MDSSEEVYGTKDQNIRKMSAITNPLIKRLKPKKLKFKIVETPPAAATGVSGPELVPGSMQTKDWRKSQSWYSGGKHTECEKHQRSQVEAIMGTTCSKTNLRFNTETFAMSRKTRPLTHEDGFEWTEDFDGLIVADPRKYYINLKMVSDDGGSQTRSLREVYHFIKCQLEYYCCEQADADTDPRDTYFVNILDGDTSSKHMSKFQYLKNKERYSEFKDNVFVGDMHTFNAWQASIP